MGSRRREPHAQRGLVLRPGPALPAPNCEPGVDTDSDGFDNDIECYVGTDPLDDCPDDPADDAWPPDINMDTRINLMDVLLYKPFMRAQCTNP